MHAASQITRGCRRRACSSDLGRLTANESLTEGMSSVIFEIIAFSVVFDGTHSRTHSGLGFEECLRHRGLGAAIAEVARLSMTASRRLQLAAEESGTIGLALRRWRRQPEAPDYGHPTAATTRWRISTLPSTPLPVPGIGRPRWRVELVRCRAGESTALELEACDDKGYLRLPADHSGRPGRKVANGLALIAGTVRAGS
jgi:hypothetical protein